MVIHADRPLADKIQRLYEGTSLEDLDAAVGVQVQKRQHNKLLYMLLFASHFALSTDAHCRS